jgi:dTDP-4-dehydrorhamnose reductase
VAQAVGESEIAEVVGLVHRSAAPAAPPEVRYRRIDLTQPVDVEALLDELRPDAVIHAAAANPGSTASDFTPVNVGASAAIAAAIAARGSACRLVHVSTDIVHDGTCAPYADDAAPTPLNDYGRSKAEAEKAVLTILPEAVLVRTSLIYGLHQPDRSTEGFLARLERGEQLRLFSDVVRQPVWVEALASNLLRLAFDLRSVAGLLNVAGREPMTRATFGRLMLDWWGACPANGQVVEGAAGLGDVPLDLRLRLDRARSLSLETPGVSDVLRAARTPS